MGNPLTLSVRREKELIQLVVTPRLDPSAGVGLLGIEIRSQPRLGFVTSVVKAAGDTWRGTVGIVQAIGQMVTGRSEVDLRGPIGIITITGQAARQGIDALITLAIGLNLNLGLPTSRPSRFSMGDGSCCWRSKGCGASPSSRSTGGSRSSSAC